MVKVKGFLYLALLAASFYSQALTVSPESGAAGLQRALQEISQAGGGEIVLGSGVYRLQDTLKLSGKGIRIRAAEKGTAILSGAMPIGAWQPMADKPWLKAAIPTNTYFRALIVNGAYAPRAEFPGAGKKLNNTNVWKVRWLSSIGNGWERAPTHEELASVFVKKGDIPEGFDPASADIRVYHDWDNSLVRVDKWFPDKLRFELKDPCRFPPGSFGRHGYILYNTKEGMLEPGNWFADVVQGFVYYWPRANETADNIKVEIPVCVRLLSAANVQDVSFEGIVFENTKPPMQRSTFSGVGIDACVTIKQAKGCVFKDCVFRNCGGIALRLAYCNDVSLEGNGFTQSGSCALQANGAGLVLTGNRFLSSGCVFTSACACSLGGRRIRFVSNEIDGAPYCGVCFHGRDNLFESNVVRNVMQSLHDGAAFYGMAEKIVFRGNRVYDNKPRDNARHAFYFDEGGKDGLIVDNYVEGGFRCCVLNHFTYNIVVSNNVFKTPGDQTISFSGSRWGTCVNNRFECGGSFERTPSVCEVTNWANNVILEKGQARKLALSAPVAKVHSQALAVPHTKDAPKIDGWVNSCNWPDKWCFASTATNGLSLHGTPRMFRACHDGTNVYLAVRAPHYGWEKPATNALAACDWVAFHFEGHDYVIRADGSGIAGYRTYAGIEKTKKKGMGWYMTFQIAIPLAEIGISEKSAIVANFDVAIHDALTGETRHHNATAANAYPSFLRFEFPNRSPRWIDVLPMGASCENPLADGIAYIFRLTPQGNPAIDRVALQAKDFKRHPTMKTGALLQCTIGHGGAPDKNVGETPWQKMDWKWKNGKASYKFCPLDPQFRAYIAQQCREIAALKPAFFMIDDDTRLEKGCYCPLHLAAYEKEKASKSWAQFSEDTLADYVQLIRDAFPPEIPGMFCCVNCTAQEGARMARIAAGVGHQPILRVGGAPYWNDGLFDMLSMRALYARERELVADSGVALLMEADTCSHILARTSATRYSDFLQLVALEGYTGAKMWITSTSLEKLKTECVSRDQYVRTLQRDYQAMRYLTESANKGVCSKSGDELGVKIVLGEKAAPFGLNDWGKSCLGRHGIPYRYGKWQRGDVVAMTGDEVKYFSDAELQAFLKGPLLLDASAATEYAMRGFGEALKAKNVETAHFTIYPYPQHYSKMKALYKAAKDEIITRLRRLDHGYVPGRVYVSNYGSYHLATGFDRVGARYVLIDNLDLDIPGELTIITPWSTEGLEELAGGTWQQAAIVRTSPTGQGGATTLKGAFLPHRPRIFRTKVR